MSRKKQIIISTTVIAALLLLAAWFTWPRPASEQTSKQAQQSASAAQFKADYPGVADDNRFVVSTPDEVLAAFDNGNGLIFLGFKECPWCQKLAPIVDEAAKAENLDKIYYLDIRAARQNNDETYQKIVAKLKDHLRKDEQGNPRVYVPDVTAVRGGQVVGHFLQETTADGEQATPDTFWTDERRAKAVEQLRQMIRQTKEFAGIQADIKNGAQLIDVRTAEEFSVGHFDGAINLPLDKIQSGEYPTVDKSTTLYVYCRSGNRSAQAKQLLEKAGFSKVKDLGGLSDVEKLGGVLIQ